MGTGGYRFKSYYPDQKLKTMYKTLELNVYNLYIECIIYTIFSIVTFILLLKVITPTNNLTNLLAFGALVTIVTGMIFQVQFYIMGYLLFIIYVGGICVILIFAYIQAPYNIMNLREKESIYKEMSFIMLHSLGLATLIAFFTTTYLMKKSYSKIPEKTIWYSPKTIQPISDLFLKMGNFAYIFPGILCLIAIMGVICLAYKENESIRRQDLNKQFMQKANKAIRYQTERTSLVYKIKKIYRKKNS